MSDHRNPSVGGPIRRGPVMGPGGAMMRGPAEKAKDFGSSLKRLVGYLRPHRLRLGAVFVLAIASTGFTISAPKISGRIMNKIKDSFMARMLLDGMEKAQEGILSMLPQPGAIATPEAGGNIPQAPEGMGLGPDQGAAFLAYVSSPEGRMALGRLSALPRLKDATDAAVKADTVRALLELTAGLPQGLKDALASSAAKASPPAGTDAKAGLAAMGNLKLTQAQLEDAIRAIRETGGKVDYAGIVGILSLLLVFYLTSALFTFATGWLMSTVAQSTVRDLRTAVDRKLSKLPLKYFDSRSHGEVLSRVTNDVDTISTTLQQSVTQAITSVVALAGFVIMMLSISWELTLIVMATLPLYILATTLLAKNSQKFFSAQQKELGAISGHIEEMYSGHAVVKAYGRERRSLEEFDAINERLAAAGRKAQFVSGILMPAMNFISNLGYVLISVVGGVWMTKARLNLGDITAFIQYSRQFTQPIIQTANIANVIQSTIACAERVFEVLDEEEEAADEQGASLPARVEGEVSIQGLAFSYKPQEPLITDLSLEVKKGQTIAIVGPTGAGKTTLVNLLMRFYEIQGGSIAIDGVDIRRMPRAGLRSLFGMVLQDTWLFNGSIKENIAYGKEGATDDEIVRAAQAAHADHFIRTLPEGYDTVLNEEATNLSQGQKQLLTIARAVLADPAILILDEATSSVDTRTEVLIQKAMAALRSGRTSFAIAHRLSTIRDAEHILVMNKGAIVERGTHAELLAAGGFYAELYNAQFSGRQLESA